MFNMLFTDPSDLPGNPSDQMFDMLYIYNPVYDVAWLARSSKY